MGGKAGLVTGAASGIGRAIAATLVESGAEVLLVDRDGPALEAAARELVAEAYAVDLAADSAPESAVGRRWLSGATSTSSSTLRGFRLGDQR